MSALDSKRFTALGREWVARFDFNATCAIEEETGKGFFEFAAPMLIQLDEDDAEDPAKLMAAVTKLKLSDMRLVLFHALRGAEPEITLAETGNIIGDIGMDGTMEVVAWAIMKAMPGADTADGGGAAKAKANPPKPRRKRAGQTG